METVKVDELGKVKDKENVSKKVKAHEAEKVGKIAKASPCKVEKKKVDEVKIEKVSEVEKMNTTGVTEMSNNAVDEEGSDECRQSPEHRPQLQYSKAQLMLIRDCTAAKQRPSYLAKEHDGPDGIWEPERWFFDSSRGNSPLSFAGERDRRRASDAEYKRWPTDAKLRVQEEEEDGLGIVLSPQRRSFGTGCHVTTSLRPPTPGEPERERGGEGRDRRDRRIGSGRIQISHGDHRGHYDRDYSSDTKWYNRERDDHRYDRHADKGRDMGRQKNYGDRKSSDNRGRRRDMRRHPSQEEEPEWFTGGPSSQSDTIELIGFEMAEEQKSTRESEDKKDAADSRNAGVTSSVNRNSSLETNESSSPEDSGHSDVEPHTSAVPHTPEFDFNEFFNNCPGVDPVTVPPNPDVRVSVSRFTQWFQLQQQQQQQQQQQNSSTSHSHGNSRRSSLNDEFAYLNDLVSGQRSPLVPSPPSVNEPKQPSFLELLQNVRGHVRPEFPPGTPARPLMPPHMPQTPQHPGVLAASDLESSLKQLLLAGHTGATKSPMPPQIPGVAASKITTMAELERMLMNNNSSTAPNASAQPLQPQQQQQQHRQHRQQPHHPQPPPPSQPQHAGDMAAFNKLLDLMKISGQLSESPKMPRVAEESMVSPINILVNTQKDAIASQRKDNIQSLLIQQQKKALQQQQQQQQQQQHQQQQHIEDQILNFMKQNPAILTKLAASPVAPQMTLQPPASPRCPSPAIVQPNLLQSHPPASPHAPSPIMFGSQPPMHLTAPSPVHPSQLKQSAQSLSPNTLQVTPSHVAMHRVPSPQELIVHTQAIMQNALIKKQLGDQLERFNKRQEAQDRTKSPNPFSSQPQSTCVNEARTAIVPGCATVNSQQHCVLQQFQGALKPTFTPTSVIRRMANEKAEVKERQAREGSCTPPACQITSEGGLSFPVPAQKVPLSIGVQQVAAPAISNTFRRPLVGQGTMNSDTLPQQVSISSGPTPLRRPIVKGAGSQNAVISPSSQHHMLMSQQHQHQRPIVGAHAGMQNVEITRVLEQQRLQQQQQQQQQQLNMPQSNPNLTRTNVAAHSMGMPGHMPLQPGAMCPGVNTPTVPNAVMMQRMMAPGVQHQVTNPMSQINQLMMLQAQVQAAAHQRSALDSSLQQPQQGGVVRQMYRGSASTRRSPNNTLSAATAFNATLSRALSPQPRHHLNPSSMPKQEFVSPTAVVSHMMPGAAFNNQQVDGNLAKWFNTDVFKQQLPNMPRLPTHNTKVLTLDEIERQQQVVPN